MIRAQLPDRVLICQRVRYFINASRQTRNVRSARADDPILESHAQACIDQDCQARVFDDFGLTFELRIQNKQQNSGQYRQPQPGEECGHPT